ncbi:MAG TPA: hypothetical protein VED41_04550, partial [Solirubrobacteraceae bacterium]|nr:hypothetical protein [Solirubrobacteraceae bacterium]
MPGRRWALACLLVAGLASGGGAAGAMASGESNPEAPAGGASPERYDPVLVPQKHAGWPGWSVVFERDGRRLNQGYIRPAPGRWILGGSERAVWRTRTPESFVGLGFLVTSSSVAAVSIGGGLPIPTASEPGLPFGLRMVAYEISLANVYQVRAYLRGELHQEFVAFDAKGGELPAPTGPLVGETLEATSWERPAGAASGPCGIVERNLPGLTSQEGSVVVRLRPVRGLSGRPFLSCANTTYRWGTQALGAAVLVDAEHPGAKPA